jgi:hypothetical protein
MGVPKGLTEKSPLQSKKFVAFLVSEITWKVVLMALLIVGIKEAKIDVFIGSIALAIVIIAGAIEALYIGGQKGLDQYTRIAQIAAGAGQNFSMGDITTSNGQHPKPPAAPPEAAPDAPDEVPVAPAEDDEEDG